MTLQVPGVSGSESRVGITRESTWGTTPTTGADPDKTITGLTFMPMKEENIQSRLSRDPQTDDMTGQREIERIISNGSSIGGSFRLLGGPESIGYFLTAIFGTPNTSTLAASSGSYEGAYQHIWYPGYQTRANWPAFYSIESQLSSLKSKLIQGAILSGLTIDVPNNGAMTISPEVGVAKKIIWLYPDADDANGSGTTDERGNTRPAIMTASPVSLSEDPFHFKHITAYPEIDSAAQQSVTSLSWNPQLAVEGLFTGGSGADIGSYRVDGFQIGGRVTMLFEDETLWETLELGTPFKLDATLRGDLIQGAYYNQLQMISYACVANTDDVVNKVGNLEYDFAWTGKKDSVEGKSCQITLINTVSSYA